MACVPTSPGREAQLIQCADAVRDEVSRRSLSVEVHSVHPETPSTVIVGLTGIADHDRFRGNGAEPRQDSGERARVGFSCREVGRAQQEVDLPVEGEALDLTQLLCPVPVGEDGDGKTGIPSSS